MGILVIPEYSESVGKQYPTVGPFKNFSPKIIGPGSGKIKAAIYFGYRFARYYKERFAGVATGIATGTGVTLDYGKTNNPYGQAIQPVYTSNGARNKYKRVRHCTCGSITRCKYCKGNRGRKRSKGRLYRDMAYR